MRFLGPQISLGASKSPNIWNFSAKSKIARNGLSFWESDLLKFLGPFVAKLELSAPKNECFRALFGQKKLKEKSTVQSWNLVHLSCPQCSLGWCSISSTKAPNNTWAMSAVSAQNLLTFLACYRQKFWASYRHMFLNNPKSGVPTMFPRLVQHQHNQSTQQQLGKIKISAILGWYSWNCPSAVGCFGWADGAPAWGTLWACKILDWPRTCAYNRPKTNSTWTILAVSAQNGWNLDLS